MKNERKSGTASSKRQQQNGPSQPIKETSLPTIPSLSASHNIAAKGHQQPQKHIYNELALRNNSQVLEQNRTCQAALSGMASGVLGLTGTLGFLFYFLCVILQAFVWHYKTGFRWSAFFTNRSQFLTHSVVSGLFTYVLFWVFVYGLVHVY